MRIYKAKGEIIHLKLRGMDYVQFSLNKRNYVFTKQEYEDSKKRTHLLRKYGR